MIFTCTQLPLTQETEIRTLARGFTKVVLKGSGGEVTFGDPFAAHLTYGCTL